MGISTAIEDVASHYLSIFVIGFYILGSLQEGRELILLVTHVLFVEFLNPMHRALWKTFYLLRAWSFSFLSILCHWSQNCHLSLWRELKQKQGKVLVNWIQWAYVGLVIFYQENSKACKTLLDKTMKQLYFTLLLRCLNKLWALVHQWAQIMKSFSILKELKRWWGFNPIAVTPKPHAFILRGKQQTCEPMNTKANLACYKRAYPRFHLRQIPGRAHKVKREIQEL